MTECDHLLNWRNEEMECPSRSLRAGFKVIYAAVAIFDLDH